MNFKILSPTWEISPEDLAEVVQLHPEVAADSAFQKIQQQVETKLLYGLGLPAVLFGPDDSTMATYTTNSNGIDWKTSSPTSSSLVAGLKRARMKMLAVKEAGVIAGRLPGWITVNRWELAEHLWVAERVFDHNLNAMAQLHRLPC